MSVAILRDQWLHIECLYCNTDDRAFGPIMQHGQAEAFLEWLTEASAVYGRIEFSPATGDGSDPRHYLPDQLESLFHQFNRETEAVA